MSRKPAVVGLVRRVDRSRPIHPLWLNRPDAELATVVLEDNQIAYIEPSKETSDALESAARALQQAGWPAHLQLDERRAIQGLAIPHIGRVYRMAGRARRDLRVLLDSSCRYFCLRTDAPERDALLELLHASLLRGTLLIVVADDAGSITDVAPASPAVVDKHRLDFKPSADSPEAIMASVSEVDVAKADALFAQMLGKQCPIPPSADCLPSNFPDHGCQARAQMICKLLLAQGVTAGKVWAYETGVMPSCNLPSPHGLAFALHVAPFLRIGGGDEIRIFDTAFFLKAASKREWLDRVGVHRLFVSRGTTYMRGEDGEGVDELPGAADSELAAIREALRRRHPSPPYRACP
jgi:hypothetical protein